MATTDIGFKFKYVRGGRVYGLRSQKGTAQESELVLGEESLPYDSILQAFALEKRLVLAIAKGTRLGKKMGEAYTGQVIPLEIYNVNAVSLAQLINQTCSRKSALRRRQSLETQGKGDQFKAVKCPQCQSAVDVSELPSSRYTYCRYCETVFSNNPEEQLDGATYHICTNCSMFGRVKGYTEAYFIFLVFAYRYSYKRVYLCDNCAHDLFKKMLLRNFIFILGIIPSVYVKLSSVTGRSAAARTLNRANALARKGKAEEAAAVYQQLYDHYPQHPALLMNEGLAYVNARDVNNALTRFKHSLDACANYAPTYQLVNRLQRKASNPFGLDVETSSKID